MTIKEFSQELLAPLKKVETKDYLFYSDQKKLESLLWKEITSGFIPTAFKTFDTSSSKVTMKFFLGKIFDTLWEEIIL